MQVWKMGGVERKEWHPKQKWDSSHPPSHLNSPPLPSLLPPLPIPLLPPSSFSSSFS